MKMKYVITFLVGITSILLVSYYVVSRNEEYSNYIKMNSISNLMRIGSNNSDDGGESPELNSKDVTQAPESQDNFDKAIVDGDNASMNKEYGQAIDHYNEALVYKDSQVAHVRLFNVYNIVGDTDKAIESIDNAIELKPSFADYWNTKIISLDERTDVSYQDLLVIYNEGLTKIHENSKVNLVISFARVAENNDRIAEAIGFWQYAIELYPDNTELYQVEVDRLQLLLSQ